MSPAPSEARPPPRPSDYETDTLPTVPSRQLDYVDMRERDKSEQYGRTKKK